VTEKSIVDLRQELQRSLADSYTLGEELGGGGMARVFVAQDTRLGRRVVVKTLPSYGEGEVSTERFRREIRVAASLQQANIVPLLSAGEIHGVPYYTMPFVEGESLRARLVARGTLPIAETIGILRDVARALAFAHARGVVHRDIKPDNVLLSGDTAVVTDFGIARAVEAARTAPAAPLTSVDMALGTPAYMAPEQIGGGTTIDARADLYALGVLAYELLTGATPFAGRSVQGTIAALLTETPIDVATRRSGIPSALSALVMACLAKDPADRPASSDEIIRVLESGNMHVAAAPAPATKPGVAVLPLANLSASADDEYFSDGMTDDIIAQLAQVGGIKVISRTSVMRYKRSAKSTSEIARELRVSHIVEGSVRRAGKRLRIVVQLVDAESDDHIWAQTFDRELDDVFAIQSEVAQQIVAALSSRLASAERMHVAPRRSTDNLDAYDVYLRARFDWNRGTPDGFLRSIEHFERALAIDPNFALAHVGLAGVLAISAVFVGDATLRFEMAKTHVRAALRLDATLPEAYATLGYANFWHDWNWTEAERQFERAIEIGPNSAIARNYWCVYLANMGHAEAAIVEARQTIDLDPHWPTAHHDLGFSLFQAGRFRESIVAIERALELAPAHPASLNLRGFNLMELDDHEGALKIFRQCAAVSPGVSLSYAGIVIALVRGGRKTEARDTLDELLRGARADSIQCSALAWAQAALGDVDAAFASIERMIAAREAFTVCLGTFLWWDPLRRDPRFDEILRRLGFSDRLREISARRASAG
jgi:serine/threonine protein kinase/tetratricopeptide (TPR) repeat protein